MVQNGLLVRSVSASTTFGRGVTDFDQPKVGAANRNRLIQMPQIMQLNVKSWRHKVIFEILITAPHRVINKG